MAINAEVTLEQILNKLSTLAEKLGDKTTAKARQEENLKRYTDRRQSTTPDDKSKQINDIATNVADIADVARKNSVSTLTSGESKRIENIAKIYGKTLKLSDNFASIAQLLKNLSTTQESRGIKLALPTFNTKSLTSDIKFQYSKYKAAFESIFDTQWVGKELKNTRRFNWKKQIESVNNDLTDTLLNTMRGIAADTLKSIASINLSKKFKDLFDKFKLIGMPTVDLSKKFKDFVDNFKLIGMPAVDLSKKFKDFLDKLKIPSFDLSKKFKDFFDKLKLPSFSLSNKFKDFFDKLKLPSVSLSNRFKSLLDFFGNKFDNIQIPSFEVFGKNIESYFSQYKAKIKNLKVVSETYVKSVVDRIAIYTSEIKTTFKDSTAVKNLKKFKDTLINLKTGVSKFLTDQTTKIANGLGELRSNATKFVDDIGSNLKSRYEKIRDSIKVIIPFRQTPSPDDKQADKQSFSQRFKSSAVGIAALGAGVALLVGALIKCGVVDKKSVLVFTGIVSALAAAMYGLSKISSNLKQGAVAIGIISLSFGAIMLTLKKLSGIKWNDIKEGLLAAGIAATGMGALVVGIGKLITKSPLTAAAGGIAMAGIALVLGMLADSMSKFAGQDWSTISRGLEVAGVAVTGFAAVAGIIGALMVGSGGLGALAAAGGLAVITSAALILGKLADSMSKFAGQDWNSIDAGLKSAGVAITGFSAVAGIIGALMVGSGGLGALVAAGGLTAIGALAKIMGYTGEQLKTYNDINASNLNAVGESLKSLGMGIKVFFASMGISGGVVGGSIQKMASWFNLDIVSQMKRYEDVDGTKMEMVGKSFSTLAAGMRDITSISGNDTNNLSASFKGLKDLERLDAKRINSTLDGIASRLSTINKASVELKDTSANFKFEVNGISEMSESIKQMGQQEVDLLQQQLMILADSRDLLAAITQNTTGISRGSTTSAAPEGSLSLTRERSTTRQSFFNNLQMMSTTLKD